MKDGFYELLTEVRTGKLGQDMTDYRTRKQNWTDNDVIG